MTDVEIEATEFGVAVIGEAEVLPELPAEAGPVDMGRIMSLAESGVDPETVGKMVDLYERVHAIQAEQAFNQAMLAIQMQMDAKPLPARGKVVVNKSGTTKPYIFLEDIQRALAPICAEHGVSYSFDTRADGKGFTVITRVSHVMGVTRETHTTLPLDQSGSKNQVQGVGSTESYGMRYGLIKAFGLARYLHDDDGAGTGEVVESAVVDELKAMAEGLSATRVSKLLALFGATTWGDLREHDVPSVKRAIQASR